jgi:hypothetical protein
VPPSCKQTNGELADAGWLRHCDGTLPPPDAPVIPTASLLAALPTTMILNLPPLPRCSPDMPTICRLSNTKKAEMEIH